MIGAIRIPRFGRKLIDLKLGFALMRDRRVPLRSKGTAVLLGLAITGLVEALELPMEGVLSMLLPIVGAAGDVAIDGLELVAGPVLLAHALLPHLAPRDVVEQIRTERSGGAAKSPVVDI